MVRGKCNDKTPYLYQESLQGLESRSVVDGVGRAKDREARGVPWGERFLRWPTIEETDTEKSKIAL